MNRPVKKIWNHMIVLLAGTLGLCHLPAASAADLIKGTVRNLTTGRPVPGQQITLLGTGEKAQEEAHARTDALGTFTLESQRSGKPHLVRTVYQGVNYDQQVSAGTAISIDVAEASSRVKGIIGVIEIIRAGSHGSSLHISDMIEVRNISNPPLTQVSERTFEVYLPSAAKIDSVLAAGPADIGTLVSVRAIDGDPGHFTVNFPLRPGATKFAFNYDLPYHGRIAFRTKNMLPLQQLAVMIPPTMSFASKNAAFQALTVHTARYKVEAAEQLKAGEKLEFELSGSAVQDQSQATPRLPEGVLAAPHVQPPEILKAKERNADASASPATTARSANSSEKLRPAFGAVAVVILGISSFLAWRRRHQSRREIEKAIPEVMRVNRRSAGLIDALKEGLFQLERDRLQGAIDSQKYASVKQALDGTIEWAVARARTDGEVIVASAPERHFSSV